MKAFAREMSDKAQVQCRQLLESSVSELKDCRLIGIRWEFEEVSDSPLQVNC